MTADIFFNKATELLESFRQFVEARMVNNGDKEEDCQRMCVLNALSRLEMNVRGVTDADLVPTVKIRTMVMGYNHGGEFDSACNEIICTQLQKENNEHLDAAEKLAQRAGIKDIGVRFDEEDAQGAQFLAIYNGRPVTKFDITDIGSHAELERRVRELLPG